MVEKFDNAEIADVLLRSKQEGPPPLSGDGQTVFKITRFAHADETAEVLLHSNELAHCRARVIEAGCDVKPTWAGGATLLVPFPESQLIDLHNAGKELGQHHIVALRSDLASINAAFENVRRRKRARVCFDSDFCELSPSADGASSVDDQLEAAVIEEVFIPSTDSSIANRYARMNM